MLKMNQLVVGMLLFLSSLFSCQQKGDFESMNVEDFDALIQDEGMQCPYIGRILGRTYRKND